MNNIRQIEKSHDSLYKDIENNLETIFRLWNEGDSSLHYVVVILSAVRLEAFINIAGALKVQQWENQERRLSFIKKCEKVFLNVGLEFDVTAEPNKTAISAFKIRDSLVHPKMATKEIDRMVSQSEYLQSSNSVSNFSHDLRSELTPVKVKQLKESSDSFVNKWATHLLDGNPYLWLYGSSIGGFNLE